MFLGSVCIYVCMCKLYVPDSVFPRVDNLYLNTDNGKRKEMSRNNSLVTPVPFNNYKYKLASVPWILSFKVV